MNAWRFRSGLWEDGAVVPPDDRGFRYGMSVFETVAVVGGRALFLKEHLVRLGRAAAARGWRQVVLPDGLPEIPRGKVAPATGVVRLYLTAGPGGALDPLSGSLFALFEACAVGTDFSPIRVVSPPAPYFPGPGGWKTGNYWQNVDALGFARATGADDALLYNPSGAIVSASMDNVFLQIAGRWVTPAREAGARDGVVRAWVMDRLAAEEEVPGPDDILRGTACFLTNSRVGIRRVAELDGRPLLLEDAGLQKRYREEILGS